MATNQNLSPPEKAGKASGAPVPTLDESLAQLEEALDLFVSSHGEGQYGETHVLDEAPSITPIVSTPKIPTAEPAPVVAAPVKDESFEQAIKELKQKIATPGSEGLAPPPAVEVVMRTPDDEEGLTGRRFPLFTDSQKKMMLFVVIIFAFFALIGYLIWQRQKSDELRMALEKQENIQLRSMPRVPDTESTPAPDASPAAVLSGDPGLAENVRQILTAYNPTAVNRYKIEVKEGVVTLSGDVQNQMEKEGVENVIKPLTGITKIVNNLAVKGLMTGPGGAVPGPNGPVMFPQVNAAEAKRLEESLKRDLAEGAKRAEEERLRIEQQNSQLAAQRTAPDETAKQEAAKQEAERLRRQQTATQHNEEDAAFRKLAEERLKQREKEEAERRAEEQRKAEPAPKPEAPRVESNALRSGTVTWRGVVKGVDDIVIRGSSASLQHVSGDQPKDAKGVFSAAMPNAPISVRLVAASGPSPIRIIQQPSAGNNFTTIVRVGDGGKADGKSHTFTLRWATQ
jgi:BON domain